MRVIVLGATGNQGSAVARHCLAGGLEVSALVRNPTSPRAVALAAQGVRLVTGDLDQPPTLVAGFRGMDGVFSVQNFWETGHLREFFQGRAVVEAARSAGVTHFIQTTAGIDPGRGSANVEVKSIIEALVREAFPSAFIIRPVWFIEGFNLTSFNREQGTLEFVTAPDQPHAWVSCDDIGRLAAAAFRDFDRFAGQTLNFASRRNSGREMVEVFNAALGTALTYHQFTDDELEAKILSWRTTPEFHHELRAIFSNIRTVNFEVDLDRHDRLLPQRHTLETWTREFALPLWGNQLRSR
jgi:uncharacterized protein YbjT (DUF2867 family)